MFHLRQFARVLTPCCLLAACASVPEVTPVSSMHPAHPGAAAALLADRPSILDEMAAAVAPQHDAMDMGAMDHSGHSMSMDEGEEHPMDHSGGMSMDEGEEHPTDHSGHGMSMDEGEEDPPDHSGHDMSMDDGEPEPSQEQDDGADNGPADRGGDDVG